jgi:hypothetical protein
MSRYFPALFALCLAAAPAGAQVLTAPQEVARCICADRAVKMLGEEVAARNRIYEDLRQQLASADAELDRLRQTMNVNDPAQVDAFRAKFDQRNQLFGRSSGEAAGDYRTTVERYNRAVAEFNNNCSGRILDSGVIASVTPTLACPVP